METNVEAKVVEETTLVKPEFSEEIKAEITGISKIEDNIQEVKQYALKLSEYYSLKQFDEETLKSAKNEKAEVNKFKDKVSEFRRAITKKYNEPLEKFIEEAQETEKILKSTYDTINNQISTYEIKQKQEKEGEVKSYFYELCESKEINFVNYEQANINVTLTASMKSLKEQAKKFVEQCEKDLILIKSLEHGDEILVEYKKTLNAANSIATVMDRHKQLEEMKKQEETKVEEKLTDEAMLNRIKSLSAPKVEGVKPKEELVTFAFEFTGPRESAKIIVNALRNVECEFRQLEKVEDHYE